MGSKAKTLIMSKHDQDPSKRRERKWGLWLPSARQAHGVNLEVKFLADIMPVLLGFGISKTPLWSSVRYHQGMGA